jgi:tetratricopeptide (TPR) repeat protein
MLDMTAGHFDSAAATFRRALAIHQKMGNVAQEALTRANLGSSMFERGLSAEARVEYSESLRLRRELGDRRGQGIALASLGVLEQVAGRFDQARECLEGALELLESIGDPLWMGLIQGYLGRLDLEEGHASDAVRVLEQAVGLTRTGRPQQAASLSASLGEARVAAGDALGVDQIEAVMAEARDRDWDRTLLEALCARARATGDAATLPEADALAVRLGLVPGSPLHRQLEDARVAASPVPD